MRAHRYVCEGRADDADVAGAVEDTHEPAGATIGLHTTRRAKLVAASGGAEGYADTVDCAAHCGRLRTEGERSTNETT